MLPSTKKLQWSVRLAVLTEVLVWFGMQILWGTHSPFASDFYNLIFYWIHAPSIWLANQIPLGYLMIFVLFLVPVAELSIIYFIILTIWEKRKRNSS